MRSIADRLAELFSPERLLRYLADDLLPDLLVAVLTFAAFYLLWRLLRRAANGVLARTALDTTARRFVETVLKYVILTVGGVTALGQLGVNTGSMLASLGVAGLTIGFAAKDALSNIISGIFIFWDRPFVIGDHIEIGGQYGTVEAITMRSTRVVTPDGRMLAIPNTEIVNSIVASYTNFPHLRLDVGVTVAVTENLGRIRELLLGLVRDPPCYLKDPAPRLVVTELNDYNVALELRVWIDDEREHVARRFELREEMFATLTEAGVEMPFQTFTLTPVTVNRGS